MFHDVIKKAVSGSLWHILGRKNMVRLGRFISNESRLDCSNDLANNGERMVQSVLEKILSPTSPNVVLDIGANIGEWSKSLTEMSRGWKAPVTVHSFEPFPATYETLVQNLQQGGWTDKVKPHCLALSAEKGEHAFYSVGKNQGRNSLYPHPGETDTIVHVPCATIDSWCQEQGIERLVLVKIDTEGHDLEVLSGASEMLKAGRIDMLQFEYNHRWIVAHHFLRDAFELLQPLKYRIGKVTGQGIEFYEDWHFELETFREGNYLAVKPEHQSLFPSITWWMKS